MNELHVVIDVAPKEGRDASATGRQVLGVYRDHDEACRALSEALDESGRQRLRVVTADA